MRVASLPSRHLNPFFSGRCTWLTRLKGATLCRRRLTHPGALTHHIDCHRCVSCLGSPGSGPLPSHPGAPTLSPVPGRRPRRQGTRALACGRRALPNRGAPRACLEWDREARLGCTRQRLTCCPAYRPLEPCRAPVAVASQASSSTTTGHPLARPLSKTPQDPSPPDIQTPPTDASCVTLYIRPRCTYHTNKSSSCHIRQTHPPKTPQNTNKSSQSQVKVKSNQVKSSQPRKTSFFPPTTRLAVPRSKTSDG